MPLYSPPRQPPLPKRCTLNTKALQQHNVELEQSAEEGERELKAVISNVGRFQGSALSYTWSIVRLPLRPSIGRCYQLQSINQVT